MRPYIAILKDSFREAMASRVLLILLIVIVVGLLAVSPFGLKTEMATQLRASEVVRPDRLIQKLAAGESASDTVSAHLWSLLSENDREALREFLNENDDSGSMRDFLRTRRRLLEILNRLVAHKDFYKPDLWPTPSSEELSDLLKKDDLSETEQKRRNLLLLAAAFPSEIKIVESNQISITYATAEVIGPVPLTPSQFTPIFERVVVAVVTFFLGFFGVFACLLVTAGIIPRTFEPGEISLLLSKPVNRSLLYLVKFLGGCIFTLMCATVLVTGVWFLLGIRMHLWRHELLWCIPVYVFIFMIYYSVSALAGAFWRNAIVAVVLVIVFRVLLLVIAVVDAAIDENRIKARGIREIVAAGDHLLTVDGRQNTYVWEQGKSLWKPAFAETPDAMNQFSRFFQAAGLRFVPVYDRTQDRILALEHVPSRFRGIGPPQLVQGTAEDNWERVPLGRVPEFSPTVLVAANGRVFLPTQNNVYEYMGQSDEERRRADFLSNLTGGFFGGASSAFRKVAPRELTDAGPDFTAAIHPSTTQIVLYGDGHVTVLRPAGDGQFEIAAHRDLKTDQTGVVAIADQHVMLGLADGRVMVLDRADLKTVDELQLPDGVVPRVCTAPDAGGHLVALTHEHTLIVFDPQKKSLAPWQNSYQPVSSAVAFDAQGRLLVADGRLAVSRYSSLPDDVAPDATWAEDEDWVYALYDYFVHPAWTVLPKIEQLDQLVQYIISGGKMSEPDDFVMGGASLFRRNSLEREPPVFRPWPVLRDNLLFVCVLLAAGCWYITRSDF